MGTRADFYVGRGPEAEWLGSIAWDGNPAGITGNVLQATDEASFRSAVAWMLAHRSDGTTPDLGWPWPWDDSTTSDYAYAFEGGRVYATCGYPVAHWFAINFESPLLGEPDEEDEGYVDALAALPVATFPDMAPRKKVTLGQRSGVIVIGGTQ